MKRVIAAVGIIMAVGYGCAVARWLPLPLDCMVTGCPKGQVCARESHSCTAPITPVPQPTPTPTPSPEPAPAPSPTPSPVCVPPGLVTGCWHRPPGSDWQFIPAPPPPPPEVPTYEMNAYWLYPDHWVADATPKQCGFETCRKAGFADGRRCCPAAPEDDPTRLEKECRMMGGCHPDWFLEVDSGTLQWKYVDDWKAQVEGSGRGRLYACFPNKLACSDKDEIVKP